MEVDDPADAAAFIVLQMESAVSSSRSAAARKLKCSATRRKACDQGAATKDPSLCDRGWRVKNEERAAAAGRAPGYVMLAFLRQARAEALGGKHAESRADHGAKQT